MLSAASDEASGCTFEEHEAMKGLGGGVASVYGEISAAGFSQLAERLRLGPTDTFVDCGSGLGRVVEQAAVDFGVRRSYGIEYAGSRHAAACARLEETSEEGGDGATASGGGASAARDSIRLIQGDCADGARWDASAGGELSAATCVYICNVLFDDALNARLKARLEASPTVQRVAAFRPWPAGLDGFGEPSVVQCETSWSAPSSDSPQLALLPGSAGGGSPIYVYERRAAYLPEWWSGQIEGMLIAAGLAVAFQVPVAAGWL